MQDHYNNLTLKTLFTLKYFLNSSNFAADPGPKYLAKVDDDTYANLPRLWNTLYHNVSWSNITDLLMGSLFNQPKMLVPARGSAKNRFAIKVEISQEPNSQNWLLLQTQKIHGKVGLPTLHVQRDQLPAHAERVSLRHEPVSRQLFIQGGVKAALFSLGRRHGNRICGRNLRHPTSSP